MRIIKTAIKNKSISIFVAFFLAVTVPVFSLFASAIIPDVYEYMSNAAKYSDILVTSSKNSSVNNGEFILCMPQNETVTEETVLPPDKKTEEAVLLTRNISVEKEDLSWSLLSVTPINSLSALKKSPM